MNTTTINCNNLGPASRVLQVPSFFAKLRLFLKGLCALCEGLRITAAGQCTKNEDEISFGATENLERAMSVQ